MLAYLIAISFWLHLLGILIWVGTALIMPLIAWPATLVLGPEDRQRYKDAFLTHLTPWTMRAMMLIVVSGLFQIGALFGFRMLLSLNTLTLKLLVFVLMIINSGRAIALRDRMQAMRTAGMAESAAYERLRQREERAGWIQVGLIMLILLLTGLLTSGIRRLW